MANEKTANIYQRMKAITAELGVVAKNLTIPAGGGKGHKAVAERDVLDAVKPLEEKHGVYSYPVQRTPLNSEWLERQGQYGPKLDNFIRLETVYRFVNTDAPEEYIDIVSYGDGIDSGDKATGKAMTYADKYALMKAYKISTGDDPDAEASGEYKPAPAPRQRTAAKQAPVPPAPRSTAPTEKSAGDELLCTAKATKANLTELYRLAARVSGVNAETVNDAIKSAYHCAPEDITVEQLLDFRAKLEARQARQEAAKAAEQNKEDK